MGNPKGSPWRNTPESKRRRRHAGFTLSDEARAKVKALAKARGVSSSRVVEDLIMEAKK